MFTATDGTLTITSPNVTVTRTSLLAPGTELSGDYLTTFLSAIAPTTSQLDVAYFTNAAHNWENNNSGLWIPDGNRDSYDGTNILRVGPQGGSLSNYGSPVFSINDITWFTPLFGQSDGLVAADVVPPSSLFSNDASTAAYLAPGKENRLQQQLDLTSATGTVTLNWRDAYAVDRTNGFSLVGTFRVVIRNNTGQLLQTLFSDNGPMNRNPEPGKVNYITRAPHGMSGWDFEYDETSMRRVSTESSDTCIELESKVDSLTLTSASYLGQQGEVSEASYRINSGESETRSWTFEAGSGAGN